MALCPRKRILPMKKHRKSRPTRRRRRQKLVTPPCAESPHQRCPPHFRLLRKRFTRSSRPPPSRLLRVSKVASESLPLATSAIRLLGRRFLEFQAQRVLRQEPPSETTSTHEVWGILLEMPERLDNLQLSFPMRSVGLRRNEFQGSQPLPPPMPILGGAQASLLQVGQLFFSIPISVWDTVVWRFCRDSPYS